MENETNQTTAPETTTPSAPAAAPTNQNTASTPEVDNTMVMGILCYLGVLVIIPYLMAKDNPFVHFHIKQGVVLAGLWIILYVAREMFIPWRYWEIVGFVNLALVILSIIGIVFVVQKKQTALPIIGSIANSVKI